MALWYTETFDDRLRFGLRVLRTLHNSTSKFQKIELFETEAMGRTLVLDGLFQTSERDEFLYHEMLAQVPLCLAPSIEKVLVIGGGDGGTAREVLKHPEVKKCVMVEIDGDVVDVCKEHLPNFGAWDDPRLELRIADGIKYAAEAPEDSFDVIILDNSDPVGPSEGLFNGAFYESVRRCLKPDGVLALQSESPLLMADLWDSIQLELARHFDVVAPYFGPVPIYGGSLWSWTLAGNNLEPKSPHPERVERIAAQARHYNLDIHRGAFAVPNYIRERLPHL